MSYHQNSSCVQMSILKMQNRSFNPDRYEYTPRHKILNNIKNVFQTCLQVFLMTDVVEVVNFLYYIHLSAAKNIPIPEDAT